MRIPTVLVLCSTIGVGCVSDENDHLDETAATLVIPTPVPTVKGVVDDIVGLTDTTPPRRYIGLSVDIIIDGRQYQYHYGEKVKDTLVKPNGGSFYAIGSTTKVFTNTLMALYDKWGRDNIKRTPRGERYVRFSSLLANHLPDPPEWEPSFALGTGRELITFKDLAYHHSGLTKAKPGSDNSYHLGDYVSDFSALMRTLDECTTAHPCVDPIPFEEHSKYSNWGSAVLGYTLASKTNQYIWDVYRQNLFSPLGMGSTGYKHEITMSGCVEANTACDYEQYGECSYKASCNGTFSTRATIGYYKNTLGALMRSSDDGSDDVVQAGSGTLWSTPDDMMKWLAYQMNGTGASGDLLAIQPLLGQAKDCNGADGGLGQDGAMTLFGQFGHTPDGIRYLGKYGDILHGHQTFIAYSDDRRIGVVVMSNYEDGISPKDVGRQLIDALHPDPTHATWFLTCSP